MIDAKSLDGLKTELEAAEAKAAKLRKEIEDKEKALAELSPLERLAVRYHDIHCIWNHTDGCGWFYEFKNKKHDWSGHAHGEYRRKAGILLTKYGSIEEAERALDVYRTVKSL